VLASLTRRESEQPWLNGATSLALARELAVDESALVPLLSAAAASGLVQPRNGYHATPGFAPELTAEQTAFFAERLAPDAAQPLVPIPYEPVAQAVRRAQIAGLPGAFDTLAATGRIVRVGEHLYRGEQLAEIRARLEQTLRAEGTMTAARFRDAVGTSRKYIVPLLEFFDAAGITVRDGDLRTLRAP